MVNDLYVLDDKLLSSLDDGLIGICQKQLMDKGLNHGQVMAVLDVQGLACPMPLLKAKVALRDLGDKQALYLLASDKNSQTDLQAFCHKNHHHVQTWATDDGVFHFIIIKHG